MLRERITSRSHKDVVFRRQLIYWLQQGYGSMMWPEPQGDSLLHFTTDTGWEGVIDLITWFSSVMPQMASLSSHAYSKEELIALFLNSKHPVAISDLPPELAYQKIFSKGLVSVGQLPQLQTMFHTAQGEIWLCSANELPEKRQKVPQFRIDNIPLLLQLSVGSSSLSVALLNTVKQGDVLLINTQISDLLISNRKVGHFNKQQGGYMFEETDEDQREIEEEDFEIDESLYDTAAIVQHKDNIKVKLNFILQQSVVTLAELEEIFQGAIMPCEPDAEKKVFITANGVTIARGEIVWIEDRVGVEITYLYQGGNDDRRQ